MAEERLEISCLADFEELRVIGRGAFGHALLVRHKETSTMCVIKVINLEGMSAAEREGVNQEVELLGRVQRHIHIIGYYGHFEEKKRLHIVLEYADAGDLAMRIKGARKKNKPFDEPTILRWFVQIACALDHVHSLKILHRDIKTQNIFLTHDSVIKLGDFGIAKVRGSHWRCILILLIVAIPVCQSCVSFFKLCGSSWIHKRWPTP